MKHTLRIGQPHGRHLDSKSLDYRTARLGENGEKGEDGNRETGIFAIREVGSLELFGDLVVDAICRDALWDALGRRPSLAFFFPDRENFSSNFICEILGPHHNI